VSCHKKKSTAKQIKGRNGFGMLRTSVVKLTLYILITSNVLFAEQSGSAGFW
jgi:hypothetical protein